jgi:hypothetical protein
LSFYFSFTDVSSKPRVKPEALAIARNHQGRELAYLFNPAMKVIPIGARPSKSFKEFYKYVFAYKTMIRSTKEEVLVT